MASRSNAFKFGGWHSDFIGLLILDVDFSLFGNYGRTFGNGADSWSVFTGVLAFLVAISDSGRLEFP